MKTLNSLRIKTCGVTKVTTFIQIFNYFGKESEQDDEIGSVEILDL